MRRVTTDPSYGKSDEFQHTSSWSSCIDCTLCAEYVDDLIEATVQQCQKEVFRSIEPHTAEQKCNLYITEGHSSAAAQE